MGNDRTEITIDEMKARLAPLVDDRQALFAALGDLGKQLNEESVVSALLHLHTEGLIRIPDLLVGITRDNADFWTLVRVLVKALALSAVPPEQFLASLQGLIAPFCGDLAMIDLTEAITSYCAAREDAGTQFIDACLTLPEKEDRAILLGASMIGLGRGYPALGHARSLALSAHGDPAIRSPAVWSLGVFDYTEHRELRHQTQERLLVLLKDEAAKVRAVLVRSLVNLLQASPTQELAAALVTLCQDENPEVVASTLCALALVQNMTNADWWQNALRTVLGRPTSTPAELQWLDHLLGQMAHANPGKAVPWIEHWAVHQAPKVNLSAVGMTVNQLLAHREVLCRCVTRWFCHENRVLQALAAHLVQKHTERQQIAGFQPLILDKAELDAMEPKDVRFVLSKIMGHCFAFEDDLVSLVFSATQKTDPSGDVQSLVVDSFTSIIGINYPGVTDKFLKAVHGDQAKNVVKRIETELAKYFDPLRKLALLRECQVSDTFRQRLTTAQNARNARTIKEVQEHSILKLLAHQVYVKHGRAFFSKIGDEAMTGQKPVLGKPTPFIHHSFSAKIPRESILDPISLDWRLTCFRVQPQLGGRQ